MSKEYVPIDYDFVEAETDLAKCYMIDDEPIWFPKSVHEEDDDPKRKVIWVEQWFAEQKGLI